MFHHERLGVVLGLLGVVLFLAGLGSELIALAALGFLLAWCGVLLLGPRELGWHRKRRLDAERAARLEAEVQRYEQAYTPAPLLPDRDPEMVQHARQRRMWVATLVRNADPLLVSAATMARFHTIELRESRPQIWVMLSPHDPLTDLLTFIDDWTREQERAR